MQKITARVRKWDSNHLEWSWLWELVLFVSLNYIYYYVFIYFVNIDGDFETRDIGIVAVGLLAAGVSLLTSYNAKENELNKYRAKWCDEIRSISNEYISELMFFRAIMNFKVSEYESSHGKVLHYINVYDSKFGIDFIKDIQEKNSKIDLYLIRGEEDKVEVGVYNDFIEVQNKVISLVVEVEILGECVKSGKILKGFDEDVDALYEDFNDFEDDFIDPLRFHVAGYLDGEWKKIKVGGFNYRVKKVFLLSFISSVVISFLSYLEVLN